LNPREQRGYNLLAEATYYVTTYTDPSLKE